MPDALAAESERRKAWLPPLPPFQKRTQWLSPRHGPYQCVPPRHPPRLRCNRVDRMDGSLGRRLLDEAGVNARAIGARPIAAASAPGRRPTRDVEDEAAGRPLVAADSSPVEIRSILARLAAAPPGQSHVGPRRSGRSRMNQECFGFSVNRPAEFSPRPFARKPFLMRARSPRLIFPTLTSCLAPSGTGSAR